MVITCHKTNQLLIIKSFCWKNPFGNIQFSDSVCDVFSYHNGFDHLDSPRWSVDLAKKSLWLCSPKVTLSSLSPKRKDEVLLPLTAKCIHFRLSEQSAINSVCNFLRGTTRGRLHAFDMHSHVHFTTWGGL